VRLNKALAAAGICSRRGGDELIKAGAVRVNGEVVESPGLTVDPAADVVEVHGKRVRILSPEDRPHRYILLHKPPQTMTTRHDPQGRTTVLDLLPAEAKSERLFPVGRLDYYSEGLLLLTTDGELTHRLTHPSHHLPKRYEVRVRGRVTEDKLNTMRQGMRLSDGEKLAPVEVRTAHVDHAHKSTTLEMVLIQGVNRQIRRMCKDLKLTVLSLKRVGQGSLQLGGLKRGQWRDLTAEEVRSLREEVGLPAQPEAAGKH
jgi:23S rRNA pseudouridine2605 synthase